MKKIFLGFLLSCMCFSLFSQEIKVGTYNIRFDHKPDTANAWVKRMPHLTGLLKYHQVQLVGTQEGLLHQLEDISHQLGYPYIGVGRDDGGKKGEFSAIFYDSTVFQVLDHGTFWLSESPDRPSVGWDASMERICTWGLFSHKISHKKFLVFNVHLDHIGQKSREEAVKLILRKTQEFSTDYPLVFMGDFNVDDKNLVYHIITDAGFQDAFLTTPIPPYGPVGTFNAFDWNRIPSPRIDYIFLKGALKLESYAVAGDHYGLKYPSDHFPVMVSIKLLN
jgi:endonuclease/exonuclease/phosphatase family metal-dependent hydrolase